jgi:lysophospholipase L1-like esterase
VFSAETARQHKLLPEVKSLTVACVGDSFTAGYDLSDPGTETFPAVLATLSGDYSFQTENYGVAGVAVNNESFLSYFKSGVCARSLQTKASVILVTLGANDAVWAPDMTDFREDYKQLLETYIKLPHAPRVIVMTPPRLLGLKGYDALMAQIVREETVAARELNLDIIDIYAFSDGMEGYSDDSVHFNAQGHRLVAEYIYKALSEILSQQP